MWTPDGDYFDETGERTSGREAIEKKYAAFFADQPGAKIEITVDAVRQIGPDAALEDGHSTLTVTPQAAAHSQYTVVHVKRDGAWQMASVREFPVGSPQESDPLEDLAWMIGTWHAEHLGAEVEVDCRWLANKSFVEVTYSKRQGKELTPPATQIIGVDPGSRRIESWMFSGDGGYATGDWMPRDAGWIIDSRGVRTDGASTKAVNMLFKVNDALIWKSISRSVAGTPLADTEEVILKRK